MNIANPHGNLRRCVCCRMARRHRRASRLRRGDGAQSHQEGSVKARRPRPHPCRGAGSSSTSDPL